jgi:predicted CXXCH cytochrome family protein
MKRITPLFAVTAMVVAMTAGGVSAQNVLGKITGSKHDLNTWGGLNIPGNQICLPCHTPHGGNENLEEGRFLWNHKLGPQNFVLYTAKFTGTRFGSTSSANPILDGESKMCLSCHDGAVSLDAIGTSNGTLGKNMTGTRAVGADDLSNDHPIGIKYPGLDATGKVWDATKSSGYFDPTQPTWSSPTDKSSFTGGAAVKLVELAPGTVGIGCLTCHTPHSNKFKYLRMSNDGSALCFKCHDK